MPFILNINVTLTYQVQWSHVGDFFFLISCLCSPLFRWYATVHAIVVQSEYDHVTTGIQIVDQWHQQPTFYLLTELNWTSWTYRKKQDDNINKTMFNIL